MRAISAFDAENRFDALLDWVEKGEEVIITRHGRPVARVVSAQGGFDRDKARTAVRNLLAASRGITLGGISIKELVDEGRP